MNSRIVCIVLTALMVLAVYGPANVEFVNDDLRSESEPSASNSNASGFVHSSLFTSMSRVPHLYDYTTQGDDFLLAMTVNSATNFGGAVIQPPGGMVRLDAMNMSASTEFNLQKYHPSGQDLITSIDANSTHSVMATYQTIGNGGLSIRLHMIDETGQASLLGYTSQSCSGSPQAGISNLGLSEDGVLYILGRFSHEFYLNASSMNVEDCSGNQDYTLIRYNLSDPTDQWTETFSPGGNTYYYWGPYSGWNQLMYKPVIHKPVSSEWIGGIIHTPTVDIPFNVTSSRNYGPDLIQYSCSYDTHPKHRTYAWINGTTLQNRCNSDLVSSTSNGSLSGGFAFRSTGYAANDHEIEIFLNESATGHSETLYLDSVEEEENWGHYHEPGTSYPGLRWGMASNQFGILAFQNQFWHNSYVGMDGQPKGPGLTVAFFQFDLDGDQRPDAFDAFPNEQSQQDDSDGDGFGDNTLGINGDDCPLQSGNSTRMQNGCIDSDGDGLPDVLDAFNLDATQERDSDQDGYGDNTTGNLPDACPTVYGSSTRGDEYGCPDSDGDGWADQSDAFPYDLSQWNDTDGDEFGDSIIGFRGDECANTPGNSTVDRFGCPDADGDGTSNENDAFPNNPTQQHDRDGDGYGDNQSNDATQVDRFPSDPTQWNDTDGDGHGDNPSGTAADRFPNDPNHWQDSDHDGITDEDDVFPDDPSQQSDRDGDGYGDNPNNSRSDVFPDDPTEWADTDADGVGDNADAFPFDPSQTSDVDGDGFGDDQRGNAPDRFPNDATQWSDIDGDGYGDNVEGNAPDAFVTDPTQWMDTDGDGYGDNPTGRQADAFPTEQTQWEDQDGDGYGDNQAGNNPDPYPSDFDNDGYNDSIDPLPKYASPGDLDNDGTPDVADPFPADFREWADADGDGEGDNSDPDDDNDGWTDAVEIRQGTDPYSGTSQPVDTFEIVIPGTQVGLGAWDLIGIFGGVPLFLWIMLGFVTRNGRTARFEDELRGCVSRDELQKVALRWEFMLMLRMLGPHQGIRLERLRAELDDKFEARGQDLNEIENEADHTKLVVEQMKAEDDANTTGVDDSKQVVDLPADAS